MRIRTVCLCLAIILVAACADSTSLTTPAAAVRTNFTSGGVTAVDLSNGIVGGYARTISSTGVILGRVGSTRVWWQDASHTYTVVDSGYVQAGNRNADIGGSQGTVLLSTSGGAPWTSLAVASPPGIAAGATIVRDLNDSRVMVGNTLGTVYAIRWDNPSAIPTPLPLPQLQYPAIQSTARSINNNGVIVGYAYEGVSKGKGSYSLYEAIIWADGIPSLLPRATGVKSQLASNINDAGMISGIADGSHPVRWVPRTSGGYDITVSTLAVGGTNLDTGIDACGRITGGSDSGAWVWELSAPQPWLLPSLGGTGNWGNALDINESGTVVGSSQVATSKGSRIQKATAWTGLAACNP